MYKIDINCDMGEGIGNEVDLMPFISSCNIACGGHAGDRETMIKVVALALENGVRVGAHPSYPDREHFGRKTMAISENKLTESVRTQIGELEGILKLFDLPLNHIKPHGALYNDVAMNKRLARQFISAIAAYKESTYLFVPYGSAIAEVAITNGFRTKYEAFADRNYNPDLSLVSRSEQNAHIQDPEMVLNHVLRIIIEKEVMAINGTAVKIEADTLCIHGDGPTTLQILMYLSKALPQHKISFKK